MSSALTYVYCLVRAPRRPSLRRAPAGMPGGGDIRLIGVEPEHWLVVSSVREKIYDETALGRGLQQLAWIGPRAVAHEAVVEHFLSSATVLPMQLFTLFTGDDRAVEHIAVDRRRLMRILSKIEGQVEWGLRIMWEPPAEDDDLRRAAMRQPASHRRSFRCCLSRRVNHAIPSGLVKKTQSVLGISLSAFRNALLRFNGRSSIAGSCLMTSTSSSLVEQTASMLRL